MKYPAEYNGGVVTPVASTRRPTDWNFPYESAQ